MELKNYQKKVMNNLSSYMDCLNTSNGIIPAWRNYWSSQDIKVGLGGVPTYQNTIIGVPHVCMKVPTGGGKTFMACAAIKNIFDKMPAQKERVVVWLVPSDPILAQTVKNLSDVNHPYRQRLETDFAGHVGIYTKEQLLNGQNFSPDTVRQMLTICILSYGSLRINSRKKDVRKVYQENGNLLRFADYFNNKDILLSNTPDNALIQVLRQLSPVTIVDESHNAESDLSVEMLSNLNPSFILDLTATPRNNSNIISYVDARELKKENMVKLPVIVYNRNNRQSVIQDAIQLRNSIEQQAKIEEENGGEYIRPIVLFQAQPNQKEKENETYDKIKKTLIDIGIPKEEIAIKTSNINELEKVDLMSHDCKIRYIITVNALKEGWDCPFAYILASLANKTSKIDVEQIVGRILRQPYAKQHKSLLLNTSYVLTSSNDFHETLENIVLGLNRAGFSRKDFRVGKLEDEKQEGKGTQEVSFKQIDLQSSYEETGETSDFSDIQISEIRMQLEENTKQTSQEINQMIKQATMQSEQYNEEISQNEEEEEGFTAGELGDMLTQNEIQEQFKEDVQDLRIPQFFLKTTPDLFGGEEELLQPENLSEGFSLTDQDAQISFELATGEMYHIDLPEQGDAIPKYRRASKSQSEFIREYLAKLPKETKKNACINNICGIINKNNRYAASEIFQYVSRIVENMTEDEMIAMETALPIYADKIRKKIEGLEKAYREKQFYQWLDSGTIICRKSYKLPNVITPADTIDSIPCSLYNAEKNDMDGLERQVLDDILTLPNILWWHRIIERKGICLNGCINHYPDFLIRTKSKNTILVEVKGDHLDGEDAKMKLKLGRRWQAECDNSYRYFMVFKEKDLGLEGAYTMDKLIEVIKNL